MLPFPGSRLLLLHYLSSSVPRCCWSRVLVVSLYYQMVHPMYQRRSAREALDSNLLLPDKRLSYHSHHAVNLPEGWDWPPTQLVSCHWSSCVVKTWNDEWSIPQTPRPLRYNDPKRDVLQWSMLRSQQSLPQTWHPMNADLIFPSSDWQKKMMVS